MNNLAPAPVDDAEDAASERYLLPRHAHIVVYERDAPTDRPDGPDVSAGDASASGDGTDGGDASVSGEADAPGASQLVTIYDCGAAQKPPSAQLLGELGSVRAACETTRNPTGYVVSMREPSVLVAEGDGQYVVRPR